MLLRVVIVFILLDYKACSKKMEPKIVNGIKANIKDWPFIAFLLYTDPSGRMVSFCGSALLSSQTILTAAHCLDDVTEKKAYLNYYNKVVLMGHNNIYKSTIRRNVVDYTTHAEYVLDDDNLKNDIGVIFLDSFVVFSNTVKKTVLRTQPLMYPKEKELLVAGWGAWSDPVNRSHSSSVTLQYLKHEFVPNDICESYSKEINLGMGHICAKSLATTDYPFSGDSGGPLVTPEGLQIGIASYKLENELPGLTMFTNIPYYLKWIERAQKELYKKYCPNKLKTV